MRWRGVQVRDLLALAGVGPGAEPGRGRVAAALGPLPALGLNRAPVRDPDTLLALEIDGEPLHIDHGFPARLIGPARPGVAQTKWVSRLVVS